MMPQPRTIAMEATIFTGWIYDHLLPHAEKVKVAHPLMLRAIAAAKKKNDRIDAGKIADCLRCDFLPECHMASTEIRDRRRTLRYRSLVIKQMVQMKNRVSGLLMETGVSYNKQRLHKVGYFAELMTANEDVYESIRPLLKLSREMISRLQKLDYALVSSLERDPLPQQLGRTAFLLPTGIRKCAFNKNGIAIENWCEPDGNNRKRLDGASAAFQMARLLAPHTSFAAPSDVETCEPTGITGLRRRERIVIIGTCKLSSRQRAATKVCAVLLTPGTSA